MGIRDGEIIYKLKRPCQIITQDGPETWETATLREPTNKHAMHYLKLEDALGKSFIDYAAMVKRLGQDQDKDEDDELSTTGEIVKKFHEVDEEEYEEDLKNRKAAVKLGLMNSDRIDRHKFLERFEQMILKDTPTAIVVCNDKHRLKKSYWDALSLDDQLDMMYTWTAFFVMPSLSEGIA